MLGLSIDSAQHLSKMPQNCSEWAMLYRRSVAKLRGVVPLIIVRGTSLELIVLYGTSPVNSYIEQYELQWTASTIID